MRQLPPGEGVLLELAVRRQAVRQDPEVDLVAVELGSVDAGVARARRRPTPDSRRTSRCRRP